MSFNNYNYSDETNLKEFTIRNGQEGISMLDSGSPIIKNCIIKNISGGDNGGGIYVAGDLLGSNVTIDGCLIYNNSVIDDQGGGIRVASNVGTLVQLLKIVLLQIITQKVLERMAQR